MLTRAGKFLYDVNLSVLCLFFFLIQFLIQARTPILVLVFASPPCPTRTHFPVAWQAYPASANFSAIVVSLSGRPYADAGGIQSCCAWFFGIEKKQQFLAGIRFYLFLFENYADVKNASDEK